MSELDDIYGNRILELAAAIPGSTALQSPDAEASAHSKLCGSTVSVAIKMRDGVVTDFSQTVKACLLGQASASVVGREIVGTSPSEIREVAEVMRKMLKEDGPKPEGRWADLGVLQPVKDYKARHTSTLLIFEALEKAFRQIEQSDDTSAYAEAG
ncbi:MAG: iron-sulfur cluster assembly scaffold protein [Pseudomonadota bacterium]